MSRLGLVLLAWVATLGSAWAQAPVNPHGTADGCASCHVPADDGSVGAAREVAASCYSCHPEEAHHPMEMVPDAIRPAAGWPLENGKVVCTTCHVEPSHTGLSDTPPPYFRGGPYADPMQFCYQCHESGAIGRADPHHASSPYAEGDASCGACHDGLPARGAAPEAALLRLGPGGACVTCHPGMPHWGASLHLGRAVADDVRAGLPAEIVLHADGTIACWTCHDVHDGYASGRATDSRFAKALREQALAGPWSDVPSEAIFPGANPEHPPMLARPLENSALCAACHGEGP